MLHNILVKQDMTIRDCIKRLDETGKQILVVVDDVNKLLGVITDGDIRRWILKNGILDEKCSKIMTESPKHVTRDSFHDVKHIMEETGTNALPVVNDNLIVTDVYFWNEKFNEDFRKLDPIKSPVVIMAGGKGTRLKPFTNVIPKPLIPIGEETIVERIISRFQKYGVNNFYMTINYKKEMIKAYFKEKQIEYKLDFVEEMKPLGTGGSLSLLRNEINETFFVSNCDVLIDADYQNILAYHRENNNKITMVTSLKNSVIPYGVINLDDKGMINSIVEKPARDFLVNTGIYVLEPECLEDIPNEIFYHITELIQHYLDKGERIGTYPISEEAWMDMGHFDEMESMLKKIK